MSKEIVHFSDFLKEDNTKIQVSNKEIIEYPKNESSLESEEDLEENEEVQMDQETPINENIEIEEESAPEDSGKYKVYKDKNEVFTCEMQVEGVVMGNTKVRLILENKDWNLVFNGEVDQSGKVSIPIKKLNILEEGSTGSIRMEVIAEDTVFVPWEQEFEVKMSKKVMVKFNEKILPKKAVSTKPNIKVNFKQS